MDRAYYVSDLKDFCDSSSDEIIGRIQKLHTQDIVYNQTSAWLEQIKILQEGLSEFSKEVNAIFFEFAIPRMGKRADVVLVINGLVFVLEFKVGAQEYLRHDKEQVLDYALDLKNFHEGSHRAFVIPILVATNASEMENVFSMSQDGLATLLCTNKDGIKKLFQKSCTTFSTSENLIENWLEWASSAYKPTPTIIQAAQALYQGHKVEEISRSDAGAQNLTETTDAINAVITHSKKNNEKAICFVTGVPGAGKTLAGLNITTNRMRVVDDEHAVFLSGNGPLVDVLREALARDKRDRESINIGDARREVKTFVQNIHHFRDDNLKNERPPTEKVVVFDEAQRAWNKESASKFMRQKRNQPDFDLSEPEFLIQVMDRHKDWCVIVALIGGGQEINTGEAGLPEWFAAIRRSFKHWHVYYSNQIEGAEYIREQPLVEHLEGLNAQVNSSLHLNISMRSFRAEKLSAFVGYLINNQSKEAADIYKNIVDQYPLAITRNIHTAREWLKAHARGSELFGLVASSGAIRLKPEGIHIKANIAPTDWFLNGANDVRSCQYLEDVATEFHIQGLELDWVGLCWDADLRFTYDKQGRGRWSYNSFKGSKWQNVNQDERKRYLSNAYRVLLTRARQGMVIYIPEGDESDITRPSSFYDGTVRFLKECGLREI